MSAKSHTAFSASTAPTPTDAMTTSRATITTGREACRKCRLISA
jgi:hypothetical protein